MDLWRHRRCSFMDGNISSRCHKISPTSKLTLFGFWGYFQLTLAEVSWKYPKNAKYCFEKECTFGEKLLIIVRMCNLKSKFLMDSTVLFSGFRGVRTHVSSRLPNCEDRRGIGTVQRAFTLLNPNLSSYWSSILCPGIFQKNYARLILVIYLNSNANLSFIKKESLDIFLNGLNKTCYSCCCWVMSFQLWNLKTHSLWENQPYQFMKWIN